ncbi:MAG TPA: hypothetical protein VFU22_23485, partial [Roseiflexaceae bacterium]|nr:hypothetical protein [Roseiflexaceae bacterium]
MKAANNNNQMATIAPRQTRRDSIRLVPAVTIAAPTAASLWVAALFGDVAARDELLARIMP